MIKIINQSVSVLLVFMLLHDSQMVLASTSLTEKKKAIYNNLLKQKQMVLASDLLTQDQKFSHISLNIWLDGPDPDRSNQYGYNICHCDQSLLNGIMEIQARQKYYLNQHKKNITLDKTISYKNRHILFPERYSKEYIDCDFSNFFLQNVKMYAHTFKKSNFNSVNLSCAQLTHVRFFGGSFEKINLQNATLNSTSWHICGMDSADYNFKNSNWSGATIVGGEIHYPNFENTTFDGTNFSEETKLENPILNGCDLRSTNLTAKNIKINENKKSYDPSDGWKGTILTPKQKQDLRSVLSEKQCESIIVLENGFRLRPVGTAQNLRKSSAGCV